MAELTINEAHETIRQGFFPKVDGFDYFSEDPAEVFKRLCHHSGFAIAGPNKGGVTLPENFCVKSSSSIRGMTANPLYKQLFNALIKGETRKEGYNSGRSTYGFTDSYKIDERILDTFLGGLSVAIKEKDLTLTWPLKKIPNKPGTPKPKFPGLKIKDMVEDKDGACKAAFCAPLGIDPAAGEKPFYLLLKEALTETQYIEKTRDSFQFAYSNDSSRAKPQITIDMKDQFPAGSMEIPYYEKIYALLQGSDAEQTIDANFPRYCAETLMAKKPQIMAQFKRRLENEAQTTQGRA